MIWCCRQFTDELLHYPQPLEEARLRGAAKRDFHIDAIEDEARLVPGFAFEGEGGL